MKLIEAWISDLQRMLDGEKTVIEAVRIGVFYTAVQVSTGHIGVAFTPRDLNDTVCCPKSAASAPPAGRMSGRDSWELAAYATSAVPLRRAVGVAVLNALSALAMERQGVPGGEARPGLDALEAISVSSDSRVVMVGGFVPFIRKLRGEVRSLQIIDKHPEALKLDERSFWVPPEQTEVALAEATVAIISGSALVEGDIDALLSACHARTKVLAGPTASPWPPPFFAAGIDVLAGIRVRDRERMLTLVSEGGSGYFFEDAAEKVSIISNRAALALEATG